MTGDFPEPFVVQHRVRTRVHDGMSWVDGHADPVDLKVFGWAPPAPDDITRPEQTGEVHVLDVYMREPVTAHRDLLIIQGVEYVVQGSPDDYRYGPFGFRPGVRVRVSRAVG